MSDLLKLRAEIEAARRLLNAAHVSLTSAMEATVPDRGYRRWYPDEDLRLRKLAKDYADEGRHGDDLAYLLAADLRRSPPAIGARLVKLGIWD